MKKLMAVLLIIIILLSLASVGFAANVFSDVPQNTWYSEAVAYVTEYGYFNGVSQTQFDPTGSMTRGMFLTVLGRMANVPTEMNVPGVIARDGVNLRSEANTSAKVLAVLHLGCEVEILGSENGWYRVRVSGLTGYVRSDLMTKTESVFTDVPQDKYYAPYVQWALQQKIVSGTTATTFSPEQPITREQLCAILFNFSQWYEVPLIGSVNAFDFGDDAQIGAWAKAAVYALRGMGVINGRDNGNFDPRAGATRAEVAVILKRYADAVGQASIPNVGVKFGVPVPEGVAVTDSYFDDACFIGHSMVVGMSEYFHLPNADFYAVNGASAEGLLKNNYFALEQEIVDENGTAKAKGNISDVLHGHEDAYKKVYIMLGTNELGAQVQHADSYEANMKEILRVVRETQPNAKIYVMSILPVSKARSDKEKSFNLQNVLTFNERLLKLSASEKVYFVDTYSLLASADGYLPADSCASDGIHILIPQYAQLKEYLKSHVV